MVFSAARKMAKDSVERFAAKNSNHAELKQLKRDLVHANMMRGIHVQDAVEIEELYRMFVFPDLPRNPGREKHLANLIGTSVSEGIYILQALHEALKIEGDICEFGVAQGATSRLLASEIINTRRDFYLFDSFEGLPAPTAEDVLIDDIFKLGSMERYQGTMKSPETEVLEKLDSINFPRERTHIMKGWVEDSLKNEDVSRVVAFAYVDFDFYKPIQDALAYLSKVMPKGGRIVVDDYGFFSAGAQKAVDEFVQSHPDQFELSLPLPSAGKFATLRKIN